MDDRMTARKDGVFIAPKVAGSTIIHGGHMVAANGDGFAVPAADAANLTVLGVSQEYVDNGAGAPGAKRVEAMRKNAFHLANDDTHPITQADVGKIAYVKDSVTVTTAAGASNDVVAGTVLDLDAGGVWVEI